nr:MAG TPA: hypothetical protein [Caudoviricetes sp.]
MYHKSHLNTREKGCAAELFLLRSLPLFLLFFS